MDKPAGLTSAAVVGRLRRASGERRVGHGGTLDPSATGVLPIFFGRATVLADYLSAEGKAYRGEVELGWASTTDDGEGELSRSPLRAGVTVADVDRVLSSFIGERLQAPPAYSAVKIDGRRSYARARAGEGPQPAARPVTLDSARLVSAVNGAKGISCVVEIECGPGFYVRSLARELGAALGGGGYLAALRRTRVGQLTEDGAITLEDAERLGPELCHRLSSPLAAVGSMLEVRTVAGDEERLARGMDIVAPVAGSGQAFARADGDRVLAIGEVSGGRFRPHRLVDAG